MWNGMDKRDQVYSRPGNGGMSHGIPGHPTEKSDNPQIKGWHGVKRRCGQSGRYWSRTNKLETVVTG